MARLLVLLVAVLGPVVSGCDYLIDRTEEFQRKAFEAERTLETKPGVVTVDVTHSYNPWFYSTFEVKLRLSADITDSQIRDINEYLRLVVPEFDDHSRKVTWLPRLETGATGVTYEGGMVPSDADVVSMMRKVLRIYWMARNVQVFFTVDPRGVDVDLSGLPNPKAFAIHATLATSEGSGLRNVRFGPGAFGEPAFTLRGPDPVEYDRFAAVGEGGPDGVEPVHIVVDHGRLSLVYLRNAPGEIGLKQMIDLLRTQYPATSFLVAWRHGSSGVLSGSVHVGGCDYQTFAEDDDFREVTMTPTIPAESALQDDLRRQYDTCPR